MLCISLFQGFWAIFPQFHFLAERKTVLSLMVVVPGSVLTCMKCQALNPHDMVIIYHLWCQGGGFTFSWLSMAT